MDEEYEENHHKQRDESHIEPNIADLENQARFLIQEIFALCEMMQLGGDSSLGHRVSSLCHELRGVRDLIIRAMEAMESNANRLEGQKLNNPEAELELKRAADIAWSEVERLRQIIAEIDSALNKADNSMYVLEKKWDLEGLERQGEGLDRMEFNNILNNFETFEYLHSMPEGTQNTLEEYDFGDQHFPLAHNLKTPLLGNVPSSSLDETLGKISRFPPIDVNTSVDPDKKSYYQSNTLSELGALGYDPYGSFALSPAKRSQQHRGSVLDRAGFKGSYVSPQYPGALTKHPTFNRLQSSRRDDTKS